MTNTRGPLPDPRSRRGEARARRSKAATGTVPMVAAPPPPPPPPPDGLGAAGAAAWRTAWSAPWIRDSDWPSIDLFAHLADEADLMRREIARDGVLLQKPITSPTGGVVGEMAYAHPLLRELRRLDAQILTLGRDLGMAPAGRARLGVQISSVAEKASQFDRLLARRDRDDGDDD